MIKKEGVTLVKETDSERASRLRKMTHKELMFPCSLKTTRFTFHSYTAFPKQCTVYIPETMYNVIEHFALIYSSEKFPLFRYSMETFLCKEILNQDTLDSFLLEKQFYDKHVKIVPVNVLSELMFDKRILFVYDNNTMLIARKGYIMENINKLREKAKDDE